MNLQQEYYKNIMETLRNAEALSVDMLDRCLKQFNKRSYESGVKGVELIGEQPTESLEKKIQEALSQLADIIEQRKNKEASPAELYEAFECMDYQCSTGIIKDCREKIIAAETPEQIDKIILDTMELTMLVKNSPKSSSQDKAYCDAECEALRKMGEQKKMVLANENRHSNELPNLNFAEYVFDTTLTSTKLIQIKNALTTNGYFEELCNSDWLFMFNKNTSTDKIPDNKPTPKCTKKLAKQQLANIMREICGEGVCIIPVIRYYFGENMTAQRSYPKTNKTGLNSELTQLLNKII